MTIPAYLPYFVFAGTAAAIVAILYGLHRSLVQAKWPPSDRARTFRTSAVILLGWLAVSVALGALGVYHAESTEIPTIQYSILLPIVIGALLIWRSETAKSVIAAVPQPWLVGVQLYRALGVIFLILYATGKLPGLFAWPAGIGDIAIGLLAPVVGLAYARTDDSPPHGVDPRLPRAVVDRVTPCLAHEAAPRGELLTHRGQASGRT